MGRIAARVNPATEFEKPTEIRNLDWANRGSHLDVCFAEPLSSSPPKGRVGPAIGLLDKMLVGDDGEFPRERRVSYDVLVASAYRTSP